MDRGQAHTLEAVMAALLVVSGVLFALDATAVTPLSASTSNQHIQNQQSLVANDLLAASSTNETLLETVVFWNTSTDAFHGAGDSGYYTAGGPPTAFGRTLNETFGEERVAFNVYVVFWRDGAQRARPVTYMGSPSDNAVAASRVVTIYDNTQLTAPGESLTVAEAAADGNFYTSDTAPENRIFGVVEVRIVAWRM